MPLNIRFHELNQDFRIAFTASLNELLGHLALTVWYVECFDHNEN